jgi:hypothetical protein
MSRVKLFDKERERKICYLYLKNYSTYELSKKFNAKKDSKNCRD